MTRSVLMVAYYAPPAGGIASVRLTGFVRHLPEFGWSPTILAPDDPAYFRDETLVLPKAQMMRTRSLDVSKMGKQILRTSGSAVRPAHVGRGRGVARTFARRVLYYPDAQVGWFPFALRAGRQAVRSKSFDAVVSTSSPITSHLIARRLACDAGVPWVAEFRDPWSQLLPDGSAQQVRAAALEVRLARDASAIVMTSRTWAEDHADAWNRTVTVIPNGCDISERLVERSVVPSGFTLAYLGSFYPEWQDLSALWTAIRVINANGLGRIDCIRFIGQLHPSLRQQILCSGLEHLVEETGFLPHGQALRELGSSRALVIAGPRDDRKVLRGHIAAKVFEYLATDRPIIYVGDLSSDTAEMMREHAGCFLAGSDDVDGVVTAITRCGKEPIRRNVSALSRRSRARQLAALLDTACGFTRASGITCGA